ncbi:TonB-dependent receptor [Paracidobacterium acidisoli]|uniref:TonB-dependent receptor n=1 Tax=Paracidobacterium acidisoli TaxID=2303751 RepID=UPI00207B032A|nr:TonB-dependent receptor [Paracidobacterium acidisoli]
MRVLWLPAALLIVLLHGLPAFAQTGRISGAVTDPDGGAIPSATVQVISQDSTIRRNTTTDAGGAYSVPFLPSGQYRILIQAQGFGSASSQMISLANGQVFVFNAQLKVAAAKTEVTVSGGATTTNVETSTATISTTLSSNEVTGLGLNGRNFSQLITLAPGVSNQTGQDEAKVGVAGSAKFSVNGGRVEYNTFEIDGSDVLNTSINASRGQGEPLVVYPSIDAIQEMSVLTSNYSALYGKSASGSVLVTTRSGTNAFHGDVYGFLRNEMFNARNYFDEPQPTPPGYHGKSIYHTPLYRRLDFGATLGGPLFIPHLYNTDKSKTFFFFSEEIRREKTPVDYNQAVPTMAERQGNFSDVCPVYVPGGTITFNPSAYPDCPHAPNAGSGILPSRTITPNYGSQAILNLGIIPEPNATFGCNTTNPTPFPRCFVGAVSPPTYWREELFRIDHNLTPTELLSFRFIHDAWNTVTLTPQWGIVQNSFPTVENKLDGPGLDMVLNLTQSLPHAFLNRIGFAYSVEHITLTPQPGPGLTSLIRPAALDDPGQLNGWTPIPDNPFCGTTPQTGVNATPLTGCAMGYIFDNGFGGNKMPGLEFQGTNGAYGGHGFSVDTGYAPWHQDNPTFTLRDDASRVFGDHYLQFGFAGSYVRQDELSAVSGADSGDLQGLLGFSNQQSLFTSGNAFADFLAGPGVNPVSTDGPGPSYAQTGIKSYTQDSGQQFYHNRVKVAELYLQDDWHVNHRFTINAGLRASFFGQWYNPANTAYNWRPENFNPSFGSSVYIDPNHGNLVWKTGGQGGVPGMPVPSGRTGPYSLSSLGPVITNGLTQCGVNGIPASCMKNYPFHPAPRMGFSWDPFGDGSMAIRAGYGLFWEQGTGYEANVGSLIGSAPLVLSETQSNISTLPTPNGSNADNVGAYNAIGYSCQGGAAQCGSLISPAGGVAFPLNVTSIPTKALYSYTQQWSLSVERQLKKNVVAQIAYVGTKGTHLTSVADLNQLEPLSPALNPFAPGEPITSDVCASGAGFNYFSVAGTNPIVSTGPGIPSSPGIGPTSPGYINMIVACTGNPGFVSGGNSGNGGSGKLLGISADAVRPYPGFSNIISISNNADSQYHALQATLRETTNALTIGVSYTYSHSLDDASDRSSANFANSLDLKSNWASSDFDERQMLNISYLYNLPLFHLLQGFANLAGPVNDAGASAQIAPVWKTWLDGWQLSGITLWQTGTPFSIINGGGSDGTGAADNAGVGDNLGIGSYVDRSGDAHGIKPAVASNGSNIGPLLYNPNAYTAPRGLTFGNSGRNSLSNPARTNFNMSLLKHFKSFHEKLDIEFRAESYNVFNHTQFRIYDPAHPGNSGNNVANCYGGIATGYSAGASGCLAGNSFLHPVDAHDPRILQFGLKGTF